ncbi:MAG: beta-ketoacyl-ACP synthase 3, partial [Acidobacteriota bacterium]|nr:beta-ketoacyl-ACP synthase 3 [Acidobacteriota bacterium]
MSTPIPAITASGSNPAIRRVQITSLGTYVPPKVLTNHDLERLVDTSDAWILKRTGIRERHIAADDVATSDLAAEAARLAIAHAGRSPEDIGFLVVGTTTPDMFFPSTACLVQHKIGAAGAWGFDLGAACSGFTYALTTAVQMVATGVHNHALAIGADVMSRIIDYKDRATCVIFGDGAGAVVVSPAVDPALSIIDFAHEVDGSGGPALRMPAGGSRLPASHETIDQRLHYVHQDGAAV